MRFWDLAALVVLLCAATLGGSPRAVTAVGGQPWQGLTALSRITGLRKLRLAQGTNRTSGRVEVYMNGRWGTVCDDEWDDVDATVVCRHLRLGEYGTATSRAHFGRGKGPIHLSHVTCNATHTRLSSCQTVLSPYNCAHAEDAGVVCFKSIPSSAQGPPSPPKPQPNNSFWSSWSWSTRGSKTNSSTSQAATRHTPATNGTGRSASTNPTHYGSTSHTYKAAPKAEPQHARSEPLGKLKLVTRSGTNRTSGRLQAYHTGTKQWSAVCDTLNTWNNTYATMACQQLFPGQHYSGLVKPASQFGAGSASQPTVMLSCPYSHSSLSLCTITPATGCSNHQIGIVCYPAPTSGVTPKTAKPYNATAATMLWFTIAVVVVLALAVFLMLFFRRRFAKQATFTRVDPLFADEEGPCIGLSDRSKAGSAKPVTFEDMGSKF